MITINKATILLSFFIIGSSLTVYMTLNSILDVIILNVCFLLIWVIATYWFKLFQEKSGSSERK